MSANSYLAKWLSARLRTKWLWVLNPVTVTLIKTKKNKTLIKTKKIKPLVITLKIYIRLYALPVFDDRYIKTKIRTDVDDLYTHFHGLPPNANTRCSRR